MIKKYLSLVKFSHTLFAMPFAIIGYFLAIHKTEFNFSWQTFILMLLCMVFARNAAMAFNRWADSSIDGNNPRTTNREIPAGDIKKKQALQFVIINSLLFVLCAGLLNPLCLILSPFTLVIILGYSYTKRFTSLSHMVLGLGLSIAPIGAYLAVTGEMDILPLLFGLVVLTWVSGFDIIYALQDVDFDKTQKLHSIPAALGKKNSLLVSSLLHVGTALSIILIGVDQDYGLFYWIGTAVFISLLIYQHTVVSPNDLSRVNLAFFTTNGIASVIFALFFILGLYLG